MSTLINRWAVIVQVGGVDYSSRITGVVRVDAEEGVARIAEFSLVAPSGSILLPEWVGAAVQIDFRELSAVGATLNEWRLFTGIMDLPEYNLATNIITCRCADNLQNRQENMTKAAITTEVGGLWSEAMFDENADGWIYTQDRLSTQPYSFDLAVDGTTPVKTAWAAKATADYTYTNSNHIYGTPSVQITPRRELHNSVNINLQYRFNRRRHRVHALGWAWPGSFCDWFVDTTTLPSIDMVMGAIEGTGWGFKSISVTKLLPSTPDPCNTGANWVISDTVRDSLVFSFSSSLFRRISQPVSELYSLSLVAPQSVSQYGTLPKDLRGALETPDINDWEETEGTDPPTGSAQDTLDDWVLDMPDRTASANAIETALAVASTGILAVHRRNLVGWQSPIAPMIDRHHTVRLNTGTIDAKGKVRQVIHTIDLDTGSALSDIRISLSRSGPLAPITPDPLTAPLPPDSTPAITPPATSTSLLSQFGGKLAGDPYDEDKNGYSGNYSVIEGGADVFTVRFTAVIPAVEREVRDNIEAERIASYSINIPQDSLTVTA